MKIAVAGDSAGEWLAKVLADHLKDSYEVAEISRAGVDHKFYANLADRVANMVLKAGMIARSSSAGQGSACASRPTRCRASAPL